MKPTEPFAFQLEVSSMLLDYHLAGLAADDLFWAPAPVHWTMHDREAGWEPDWAETEPDPVPVPTIAWLTWHLQWWWSSTLADVHGRPLPSRTDVGWVPDPRPDPHCPRRPPYGLVGGAGRDDRSRARRTQRSSLARRRRTDPQ